MWVSQEEREFRYFFIRYFTTSSGLVNREISAWKIDTDVEPINKVKGKKYIFRLGFIQYLFCMTSIISDNNKFVSLF